METFAEKLHAVRKERDYTQDKLSKEMNVSRQTISHWENGRAIPDIDTIKRLSKVLDYNFLTIEGMMDEAQNVPVQEKETIPQAENRDAKAVPKKKKKVTLAAGITVLCAVLLGAFIFMGKNPQSEGKIGDYDAAAAQKANVVITPVENPVPLMVIEDFPDGYGWLYEVVMEETTGVPFTARTLTQAIVYEGGIEYPSNFVVDHIIPAWGGDTLYKDAPRNWRGGIPLQPEPVKAIRLILCGTDANGNEVEAECTIELLNHTAE